MKTIWIDAENGKWEEIEFIDKIEFFYEKCNCNLIDITEVCINGKWFDVICDDEGLLKSNPIPSAITTNKEPRLFGNLLICKSDDEGNSIGLTDAEIEVVKSRLATVLYTVDLEGDKTFVKVTKMIVID